MDWTQEEYDRLSGYYRDCDDKRLLQLSSSQDELTTIARELLGKELKRRGIDIAGVPSESNEEAYEPIANDNEMELLWKYASLAPEECTFSFSTNREAYAANALLLEAGIASVVVGDREVIKNDLRPVRTIVKPGDAERAAGLLSAPLPQRLLQEADTDPGDFVEPVCPECGAADPLLQAYEPVNQWLCEECGKTWEEAMSEAEGEAGTNDADR